ncbi:hypothetical protein EV667_1340 [Ancylobacter aquaticus]|uniref:Uncharacterized protein n=1 Tax=Ancylobacter aquaticus TaxID=100 RepID=A0A4R1I771_ANCAQ|nr:hypothetical protein [Ancylobacter aquaticus]TCK31234.1 hypothetical protein EV667_1340 [Ancylobacter aquaticus]
MNENEIVVALAEKVRRQLRDRTHAGSEGAEAELIAQGASPADAETQAAAFFGLAMNGVDAEMPRLTGEIREFVREAARR